MIENSSPLAVLDNPEMDPVAYPPNILQGDNVTAAFKAIQERLKTAFPISAFNHVIMPPSPTKEDWQEYAKEQATVALSLRGWNVNHEIHGFRGDLAFSVGILLTADQSDDLYLGTGELRGMGASGVMCAAASFLDAFNIHKVGTVRIRNMSMPAIEDWFGGRSALVAIALEVQKVGISRELVSLLYDYQRTEPEIKKGN